MNLSTDNEISMDIEESEIDNNEEKILKIKKTERKLPFSIENLLSDKIYQTSSSNSKKYGEASSSKDIFNDSFSSDIQSTESDDEDRASDSSEQVDVEGSVANDAQESYDVKADYQQSGSNTSRGKRARTAFSAQQIKSLEAEFEKNRYLSVAARGRLARQLRLTETQIKIWFQNRRTKWKRKYTNDVEILAQQYYSSIGLVAQRPMFVGDRLWIFNYPNRLPASQQQQQWMKNLNATNIAQNQIDRNLFRNLPKPDIPPFMTPPHVGSYDRGFIETVPLPGTVKVPAQTRLLPREVFNNMATAHRNMEIYKNNILNHNNTTQDSNVDHLRRLEENFSI